jgi:hypothetical protein
MKRWLALFMILWLPLQLGWTVAAAYCQHESPSLGSQHFGHHSHEHRQAHPGDGAHHQASSGLQADTDCTHCHASASASCVAHAPEVKAMASAHPRPQSPPSRLDSAFQRPPDRPQWQGLA